MCVCVCSRRGREMAVSTAVRTAVYRTGYSGCLTGFREPFSPPHSLDATPVDDEGGGGGDADNDADCCRHNDLPWQFRKHVKNAVYSSAADLEAGWPVVHTDIPRLRQGKLGAQVRLPVSGRICVTC